MAHRILILFAHPRFEQSRTNQALVDALPSHAGITFHDLYEHYADFNVDVAKEKQLLLDHDIIVWHHPLYWYSCPPLLKQWIDMVLEFGWAYGKGGDALAGKLVFNAFTSGGPREAYTHTGRHKTTIQEFFLPFDRTARLCQMEYLPPFGVQGSHRLTEADLKASGEDYARLLTLLAEGSFTIDEMKAHTSLNDWMDSQKTTS